jgi:hypothetical protein
MIAMIPHPQPPLDQRGICSSRAVNRMSVRMVYFYFAAPPPVAGLKLPIRFL